MRLLVFFVMAAALLVGLACGDGDTSLEDIGAGVQGTLVAESTIAAATFEALPTELRNPTATPDPDEGFSANIADNLNALARYGQELGGFFTFFEVRIGEPGEVGSLSDDEGNLPEGWIGDCCPRQLVNANDALADANAVLDEIERLYLERDAAEHVALIPEVRTRLVDTSSYVDQLANAQTHGAATLLIAAGSESVLRLKAAIEAIESCCVTPTPTPSPVPTP